MGRFIKYSSSSSLRQAGNVRLALSSSITIIVSGLKTGGNNRVKADDELADGVSPSPVSEAAGMSSRRRPDDELANDVSPVSEASGMSR